MFTILLSAVLMAPPEKPKEIDWQGGPWTGEDSDKGKEFAPKSFKYTPIKEYKNFLSQFDTWVKDKEEEVSKLKSSECTFNTSLFDLNSITTECQRVPDSYKWEKNNQIKAYGGIGEYQLFISPYEYRYLTLTMYNMDLNLMSQGINLKLPIRVDGKVKRLTGFIIGDRGEFVTSEVVTTSSIRINRLTLKVDLNTLQGVATGDTSMGTRSFNITLPRR